MAEDPYWYRERPSQISLERAFCGAILRCVFAIKIVNSASHNQSVRVVLWESPECSLDFPHNLFTLSAESHSLRSETMISNKTQTIDAWTEPSWRHTDQHFATIPFAGRRTMLLPSWTSEPKLVNRGSEMDKKSGGVSWKPKPQAVECTGHSMVR